MIIGIKYCGGCNSTYDRAQEVRRLMADFLGHTWVYAAHGVRQADYWLIVCGCSCICANTDGLEARRKIVTLQCPDDFTAVRSLL